MPQAVVAKQVTAPKTGETVGSGTTSASNRNASISLDEYLRRDREEEVRHEFRDGRMVAMADGSRAHSRLKVRLASLLDRRLMGRNCQPYDGDFRIIIVEAGKGYFPDASIFCGPPESSDGNNDNGTNPTAIFEVLSDSTEDYDRGRKFVAYRRIPALQVYVLISQYEPLVEVYERQSSKDEWLFTAYPGTDAVVPLRPVELEISVHELYEGIELSAVS